MCSVQLPSFFTIFRNHVDQLHKDETKQDSATQKIKKSNIIFFFYQIWRQLNNTDCRNQIRNNKINHFPSFVRARSNLHIHRYCKQRDRIFSENGHSCSFINKHKKRKKNLLQWFIKLKVGKKAFQILSSVSVSYCFTS